MTLFVLISGCCEFKGLFCVSDMNHRSKDVFVSVNISQKDLYNLQ